MPPLPPLQGKFAATVRVGEKGQIVIPKAARNMFDIKPGDVLLLLADDKRGIAIIRRELFEQFTDDALSGLGEPDNTDEKPSPHVNARLR